MKRERIRQITPKELANESEGRYKFFKIKYNQWDDIIPKTGEYQKKENVMRILDSPATTNAKVWVIEVVDDDEETCNP